MPRSGSPARCESWPPRGFCCWRPPRRACGLPSGNALLQMRHGPRNSCKPQI
jgi:hypothetical protein